MFGFGGVAAPEHVRWVVPCDLIYGADSGGKAVRVEKPVAAEDMTRTVAGRERAMSPLSSSANGFVFALAGCAKRATLCVSNAAKQGV